jgi:hypothetical protein
MLGGILLAWTLFPVLSIILIGKVEGFGPPFARQKGGGFFGPPFEGGGFLQKDGGFFGLPFARNK